MSKGKLAKFADMASYPHVFEYPYSVVEDVPFEMRGHWREQFFKNDNPIVLELGCGRGEYAVGLARRYPDRNFIGVDIKGARMWSGATDSLREGLKNVAFLRTNIEIIDRFFAPGEVQEIWLTFSDPQMKKATKRLTSTYFLNRYRHFLCDNGIIHLKTDSNFLFTYTRYVTDINHLPVDVCTEDLYKEQWTMDNGQLTMRNEQRTMDNRQCTMKNEQRTMDNEISPSASPIVHCPLSIAHSSLDLSIRTYYEQQWLARGITIKYLRFHLPATGTLVEPEVDIPLDDYRSYNRDKRSSLTTSR